MKRNIRNVFLWMLVLTSVYSCSNSGGERYVPEKLRASARENLRQALQNNQPPEKILAAGYLLYLGYTEEVNTTFFNEGRKAGNDIQSRIGIWHILAQASLNPEIKQQWVDSIIVRFRTPSPAVCLRAAEALAKLNVSPFTVSREVTDSILSGEHDQIWAYTLWGTAFTSELEGRKVRQELIKTIVSPDESPLTKRSSAYALRHLKKLGADDWNILCKKAITEPDSSLNAAYFTGSALISTPADSLCSALWKTCRLKLDRIISSSCSSGKIEALEALAEIGDQNGLPVLTSIIERNISSGTKIPDKLTLAASNSILRIDRHQKYSLKWPDWIVIFLYGLGMLMVGWHYSRKTKNPDEYHLGGRKMKPVAVGVSLFATMVSSLSYLSYPGEMIKNGPVFFIGMLIFPLTYYIVGWFIIPKFMEMKVSSAYELLEVRLGLSVRLLATFFFLTLRFLWMATIIYATIHTALAAIVDIDPSYAPLFGVMLMSITILYTSMGGFKAVVATDVIQSVILWGGAFLTIIIVCFHFHSLTSWLPGQWLSHWAPLKWGLDTHERSTVGNVMVMLFVWFVCTNGSDQMAVQRYLSTKDIKSARHTFGISLISTFIVKIFLAVVGLAMIAFFSENPHFLGDGETITGQADQLFPKFILIGLPVGLSGLVASGIFAAAMSSLSSGLNSSSSVISEDIIKRLIPKWVSPNPLKQVKLISVFVGIIAIFISLAIANVQGNLLDVVIKVVNLFVAPLFVLFFLAMFIPFATSRGTVTGGIASIIIAVAIAFYGFLGIQVLWIMPVALVSGAAFGIVASLTDRLFNIKNSSN